MMAAIDIRALLEYGLPQLPARRFAMRQASDRLIVNPAAFAAVTVETKRKARVTSVVNERNK
jgi:hypothetical protein